MRIGDDVLDTEIAALVFGVKRDAIEAWPWGVPKFSTDRRWSAAVVTAMWNKPDDVRQLFEKVMFELSESLQVKGGFAEAMVLNTPEVICNAALIALRECGSEVPT